MTEGPVLALLDDEELRRWLLAAVRLVQARAKQDGLMAPQSVADFEAALSGDALNGQERTKVDGVGLPADDGFMSRQQAASFLSISDRQLARLTASGRVKSVSLGRRRLYKRSDLEEL